MAGLAALVFAGALTNGWVRFDDDLYVFENPIVSQGLTLRGVETFLHAPHGANWVPLTAWSHLLDVTLYGLAPAGHHATSILLHVLNTVLLALVLRRMTGAWWRSLFVAAFFSLHPLRVESVAWIAERKDVLSTFFMLLALFAYARWAEHPGRGRFALVAGLLACGLASKPMLVTVPFLLVLLDFWPLGRWRGNEEAPGTRPRVSRAGSSAAAPIRSLPGLVEEKWLLFVIAALAALVAYLVQREAGALHATEWVPLARRAANAALAPWRYIGMTLWPHRLSVFHPFEADAHGGLALAAAAALVLATAGALACRKRAPWVTTGWLWYLGMLVPVAGFVQTGHQAYADRFTYVPGIGLAILFVWSVAAWAERHRAARILALGFGLLALAACGNATVRQVRVWKDTRTLFERVLATSPGNPLAVKLAHRKIGAALLEAGRPEEAVPHLEQWLGLAPGTEAGLRRSLALHPEEQETRRTLAATLVREDRVEEGISEYERILAQDPADLDALTNIAWIRATHAQAAHRNGAEAVQLSERARDASPEPLAVVYSTLAASYAEAGRYAEAVQAGTRAVDLARAAGEHEVAARYAHEVERYRAGQPFHFED